MKRRHHRFERQSGASLQSVGPLTGAHQPEQRECALYCGWGRLLFGQTFADSDALVAALRSEHPGERDIAIYLRDPHVVLAKAPHELFLDPSHTYRLWLDRLQLAERPPRGFIVRRQLKAGDAMALANLYRQRGMIPPPADFLAGLRDDRRIVVLVAEDASGQVLGTAMGVDHVEAFGDPENGSSLWCLAVDGDSFVAGVGEALVRHLSGLFLTRGRAYLDLSVLHDNQQAIALYEKIGFVRVPVFTVKRKNPHNEPLYIAPAPEAKLNPYAAIIVREARCRGIAVEVLDEAENYFSLGFGGRSIVCRESLSELTSAVAMSRCDNKAVTRRLLAAAGLKVSAQRVAGDPQADSAFLGSHGRVVVKPARGEQGAGISVDIRSEAALQAAISRAEQECPTVLLESFVAGEDLRIVVIGHKVVAAAVRRPARVRGDGTHDVRTLIEKQSRRRAAATGGESRIPLDAETERCVEDAGYQMDSVLAGDEVLIVRKTANLHTGGTISDVTEKLHPALVEAAEAASRALNIPVVGLDFLVPSVSGPDYAIIEANERPGLANHEPRPTAERFIDLLFPQTAVSLDEGSRP